MSFDWMNVPSPKNTDSGKLAVVRSLREQAALLRRLGYDVKYTTSRCLANLHWQFDGGAKPPLKDSDVKKLVRSVFS